MNDGENTVVSIGSSMMLLDKQIESLNHYGKPSNHIVCITGEAYHKAAEEITKTIVTKYVLFLPEPFCISKSNWIECYENLVPADAVGFLGCHSYSIGGYLCGPPPGIAWASPPHLRLGGLLVKTDSFIRAGQFGATFSIPPEIGMSRSMLALGMIVRVIEDSSIMCEGEHQ